MGFLLDIKPKDSKTLGNKSTSLSLKTKIDILTDMNAMKSEDAKKFILFMQIRNQFMHNLNIKNFESCLNKLNGSKNLLFKYYPSDSKGEIEIEKSFDQLVIDLSNIIMQLDKQVAKKLRIKIERDFFELELYKLLDLMNKDKRI